MKKRIRKKINNYIQLNFQNVFIEEESVPVSYVASKLHIKPEMVRKGMREGTLKIGRAFCIGERYQYYISSRLLYEQFGIVYKK